MRHLAMWSRYGFMAKVFRVRSFCLGRWSTCLRMGEVGRDAICIPGEVHISVWGEVQLASAKRIVASYISAKRRRVEGVGRPWERRRDMGKVGLGTVEPGETGIGMFQFKWCLSLQIPTQFSLFIHIFKNWKVGHCWRIFCFWKVSFHVLMQKIWMCLVICH